MRREVGDSTRPSVAVVETVATMTGCDPYDVPPLYEAVDPDALDDLFSPKHDGTPRMTGSVTFELAGCEVTVAGRGEIMVRQIDVTAGGSDAASASGSV